MTLSSERRKELDEAFLAAKACLPEQSVFGNLSIPASIPPMARRVSGDLLGWPLHLRNRGPEDPIELPMVTPVMRHKPNGVVFLEPKRRVPRANKGVIEDHHVYAEHVGEDMGSYNQPEISEPAAFAVGTQVRKFFDGQMYQGTVAKVDDFATGRFYLVIYEDGNQEHLTAEDLEKCID